MQENVPGKGKGADKVSIAAWLPKQRSSKGGGGGQGHVQVNDARKGKFPAKCRFQRKEMRASLARHASCSSNSPTSNSGNASATARISACGVIYPGLPRFA
jgi:hypothetical protein